MSFFQVSCLITFLISFLFGFFVFLNNRKSKSNILWFLTSLSISIWSLGFFGVVYFSKYSLVWISQYFLDIGGILIPILFLNFVIKLIDENRNKYKKIIVISWIVGFFLILLNFTELFKKGMVEYSNFRYWINPGPLYFLFPLSFILFTIYAGVLLIRSYYQGKDRVFKAQIRYIILAQIFGFGGGVTNFFPQLFKIYPFGNYLVVLYIIFISYAILKHNLFNVKVIATELFTLVICITLFVRTLLSENLHDLFINGIIGMAVGLFSILLIKSVWNVVKQREQIEKMAEDIKRAYEVEKQAHEELRRLDEAKTQFMMATQHHLRTPLTAIRGYLDLLITGNFGKLPKKVVEVINKIQVSAGRLNRVVNEFLDVSQFQLGKEVVSLQPGVDLRPIIDEIIEELSFEAKEKKLYLKIDIPEKLPKIKADSEKLKIALFNIFDNGIKYTSQGGIDIKLRTTDSQIRITIKDTGIGIPKKQISTLFTRVFERGEGVRKIHGTGRGIGLYIASHIIEAHKGRIWAESEGKGKGSIFYIELPVAK